MHIFNGGSAIQHLSFEFFPPRTPQGLDKLIQSAKDLNSVAPEYFSVTFGAGGSLQEKTRDTVYALQKAVTTPITPHLSCIGVDSKFMKALLDEYQQHQIKNLVVIRGDLPSGMGMDVSSEFHYANELVAWIRKNYGDYFHIHVACYPESHPQSFNAADDFKHFVDKAHAGADVAITQYFFNPDSYYYFVDKCRKANIDIPIVPGIMPISNYYKLARFSEMCGAEIPRWVRKQLEAFDQDETSLKAFGVEVVTELCQNLIEHGVPGLHFYSLNDAQLSLQVLGNLK